MIISSPGYKNLSTESGKNRELIRLEGEFQELKQQALILKEQGRSSEYERIKAELKRNINKRKQIYWG